MGTKFSYTNIYNTSQDIMEASPGVLFFVKLPAIDLKLYQQRTSPDAFIVLFEVLP